MVFSTLLAPVFRAFHGKIIKQIGDAFLVTFESPTQAVLAGVGSLTPGYELLTIYYGDGTDLATTELLARRLGELALGAEVEVVHGGQPHYRYLISAE